MKFGNFEQQPKVTTNGDTLEYEPKLWQEKVDEIKDLMSRQLQNPDIFSEYEADHLDAMATAFPLEYAAAQGEYNVIEEDEALGTETIKQNLVNAGKGNIAHKFEEIEKLEDLSKEDIEAFKKNNKWGINFGEGE